MTAGDTPSGAPGEAREGREGGARRGRRRGRRGRRGGQGREAGPNEGHTDLANEMDDAAGDEPSAHDNPGRAADETGGADASQGRDQGSEAASTPPASDFVVPPPPSETRITWTGMAAPEPATPAAEAAPAVATDGPEVIATPTAESPTEATPEQAAPAVTSPTGDAPATPAATTPASDTSTEKKVVWSSSPSSYGSSSYSSRRDDY